MLRTLAAALLAAAPAAAQERPMTPEAFLAMASGNTLDFVVAADGSLVGIERFLSAERTVWAQPDGRCAYGDVEVRGAKFCFFYDDEPGVPHCWTAFEAEGKPHVRSTDTGEVQRVERISRDYVGCDGEPLS